MLTMSKPLSAGQARRYHAEEFRNARDNYYSEGDRIVGHWHGQLAARWGLDGEVGEEQFAGWRTANIRHTGEQLDAASNAAHSRPTRAARASRPWSIAPAGTRRSPRPKSVSITALVGGDERIRDAHRESVAVALDELERYAQARLGGDRPAETTGQWVAATFEHDSARPVDGYAAPQVHTHAVIFNLTETGNGDVRALQPRELYRTQQYATAVYRSELAIATRGAGV